MAEKEQGTQLIRNSVLTIINNLISLATSWVISIWVARSLGPTRYGIFSLVLWLSGTVSWALGLGLIHATTKFIAECNGKGDRTVLRPIVLFVLKIEIILAVATTAVLSFLNAPIADYFFNPSEGFFFLIAFLGLLPGVLTAIFSATIEGLQKFEYFLYANLLITPLSFGAKVFALLMGWGISGQLAVMLIFSAVNAVFYGIILHREGVFAPGALSRIPAEIRARILRYNASVMAILVCDKIVWDKSENFFLGRLCSATQIAYYNLGFNIAAKFTSILPTTFWRVLFPAMSHYFGSGDQDKMKRIFFLSTRYLAFFSFPVGVAGAILAFPLIRYLYGHEFIEAQRTLQIIFLASIVSNLANPGSAILYGYEKQSFIYKYGAFLAVFNILLDIALIKPYGALGAAVCYAITTVFATTGGLVYTCRTMQMSYPFVSVVKVFVSTVIMGIVMQLIMTQLPLLPATICAAVGGTVVYFTCALVLGTFEKEDYVLLESVKKVLPGKTKNAMDVLIGFISQFKNQ